MLRYLPLLLFLIGSQVNAAWYYSEGMEVWPTAVEVERITLSNASATYYFERPYAADHWESSDPVGADWVIEYNDVSETFELKQGGVVKADLGDRWWSERSKFYTIGGVNYLWYVHDYEVDWLRVDVAWIPLLMGVHVGLGFDFVLGVVSLAYRAIAPDTFLARL